MGGMKEIRYNRSPIHPTISISSPSFDFVDTRYPFSPHSLTFLPLARQTTLWPLLSAKILWASGLYSLITGIAPIASDFVEGN